MLYCIYNTLLQKTYQIQRAALVLEERGDIFGVPGKWERYVVFGARDDSLSDFAEEIAGRLR